MMFQDEQLFPHLDVAANVAFGLRMQRRPRLEAAPSASPSCCAIVGLDGLRRRAASRDLSGGEAKRVALARSLGPASRPCCCSTSR